MSAKTDTVKESARNSPCLCFQLRKASRAITQVYDHMLRETGLTACQMMILNVLAEAGAITVTQLAEAIAADRTTITRNLQPLERKGLLSLKQGKDRRSRQIGLTEKGQKAVHKAEAVMAKFQDKLHRHMDRARLQSLCDDLRLTISKIREFSI